jgi:hypothetical protein
MIADDIDHDPIRTALLGSTAGLHTLPEPQFNPPAKPKPKHEKRAPNDDPPPRPKRKRKRNYRAEARRRGRERRRDERRQFFLNLRDLPDDACLLIPEWAALNSLSERQARRILASGDGPTITKLSAKRRGITIRDNREWQQRHALAR